MLVVLIALSVFGGVTALALGLGRRGDEDAKKCRRERMTKWVGHRSPLQLIPVTACGITSE